MQITAVALLLFTAMGVMATPVESKPDAIQARDGNDILITYEGDCDKHENTCKYKNQEGKTTIVKCPEFANKKCTANGKPCTYDSVDHKVTCD